MTRLLAALVQRFLPALFPKAVRRAREVTRQQPGGEALEGAARCVSLPVSAGKQRRPFWVERRIE